MTTFRPHGSDTVAIVDTDGRRGLRRGGVFNHSQDSSWYPAGRSLALVHLRFTSLNRESAERRR